MDTRKVIAKRLSAEIVRKGFNSRSIAHDSGIDQSCIEEYLAAKREVNFAELNPICAVLDMRIMNLLANKYDVPRLQYRSTGSKDRAIASAIENSFLLLADLLPSPKTIPGVLRIDDRHSEFQMLLFEVSQAVEELRTRFKTVEELYFATGLPILPISAGRDSFDAFLLSVNKKSLVCINRDKPPARIHFSLLHEMAHFLFHRDRDIPVDNLEDNFYGDTIQPETVPEYVANKFAQQYIVSFAEADKWAVRWREKKDIEQEIYSRRTTPDVLANAIYDSVRMRPNKVRYTEIRDAIKDMAAKGWNNSDSILKFVEGQGQSLKNAVSAYKDEYSDEIWRSIEATWELHLG